MDNSSGSKTGQPAFDTIPKTQGVSDQYNTPQQNQQTANTDPFEDFSNPIAFYSDRSACQLIDKFRSAGIHPYNRIH